MTRRKLLAIGEYGVELGALRKLRAAGEFETLRAGDAEAGLRLLGSEKPELVFLDPRLSGDGGLEAVRAVRRLSPDAVIVLAAAVPGPAAAPEKGAGRGAGGARHGAKPNLLVLDDDGPTRVKLEAILSREGYNVYTGADGKEGLKAFEENRIDVVLTDMKMPEMGGLEVLHKIRRKTADCEVILVTAYGDEDSAIQALRAGAADYIRKPVDLDYLLLAIENALGRLAARRRAP